MAQQADPTQKLASVIKPIIEECLKLFKESNTVEHQEILLQLKETAERINILEKLVAEKKKTPRGEKKAGTAEESPAEGAAAPAAPVAKFPINKMIWFREQYKADLKYRERYVTPEMAKAMETEPTITTKTNPQTRLIAEAQWVWGQLRKTDKNAEATVGKEYQEAKAAYEAANKPAQQQVEANTPTEG